MRLVSTGFLSSLDILCQSAPRSLPTVTTVATDGNVTACEPVSKLGRSISLLEQGKRA